MQSDVHRVTLIRAAYQEFDRVPKRAVIVYETERGRRNGGREETTVSFDYAEVVFTSKFVWGAQNSSSAR